MADLKIQIGTLNLQNSVMTASGTFGIIHEAVSAKFVLGRVGCILGVLAFDRNNFRIPSVKVESCHRRHPFRTDQRRTGI